MTSEVTTGRLRPTAARARVFLGLIALALLLAPAGCKTPSFGNQLETRQEALIGAESAAELEAQYPPVTDPAVVERVDAVARRVFPEAMAVRDDITYRVKVIPGDNANAFSLPGGWIYLTTAMMTQIGGDDNMLAFVIAHEAAHVAFRQGATELEDAVGQDDLIDLLTEGKYQDVANIALQLDQASHSREDEYQADRYGIKFAANAGYDPNGALRFFELIQNVQGTKPAWTDTHPLSRNRILRAQEDIKDLKSGRY